MFWTIVAALVFVIYVLPIVAPFLITLILKVLTTTIELIDKIGLGKVLLSITCFICILVYFTTYEIIYGIIGLITMLLLGSKNEGSVRTTLVKEQQESNIPEQITEPQHEEEDLVIPESTRNLLNAVIIITIASILAILIIL